MQSTRSGFVRRRSSSSHAVKATMEQRVMKLARKVNALNPELKSFQAASSFTNVSNATGQIVYLSAIAQGADVINRIGDKLQAREIDVKVKCTGGIPGTTTSASLYGIYLVRDLESNGVLPTVSGTAQSIFVNPGPVQAFINESTKDRFKIVKKWVWSAGMLVGGNIPNLVNFKLKLNHAMNYHDTTGAQTGAGKNAYYLVALSDDGANTVGFAMYTEIRFTDA